MAGYPWKMLLADCGCESGPAPVSTFQGSGTPATHSGVPVTYGHGTSLSSTSRRASDERW